MGQFEEMKYYLEELEQLLMNLFQGGFASVPDMTLEELKLQGELSKDYGLFHASEMLAVLYEELSGSRHRFQKEFSAAAAAYAKLTQYTALCRKRLELLCLREEQNAAETMGCHVSDSRSAGLDTKKEGENR